MRPAINCPSDSTHLAESPARVTDVVAFSEDPRWEINQSLRDQQMELKLGLTRDPREHLDRIVEAGFPSQSDFEDHGCVERTGPHLMSMIDRNWPTPPDPSSTHLSLLMDRTWSTRRMSAAEPGLSAGQGI